MGTWQPAEHTHIDSEVEYITGRSPTVFLRTSSSYPLPTSSLPVLLSLFSLCSAPLSLMPSFSNCAMLLDPSLTLPSYLSLPPSFPLLSPCLHLRARLPCFLPAEKAVKALSNTFWMSSPMPPSWTTLISLPPHRPRKTAHQHCGDAQIPWPLPPAASQQRGPHWAMPHKCRCPFTQSLLRDSSSSGPSPTLPSTCPQG